MYTPAGVAAFLIQRLVEHAADPTDGPWLDPACGDGVLLEMIVEHLARCVQPDGLAGVVERSVFGVDIDPWACRQARSRLVRAVERHSGPVESERFDGNVRCADFLAAGDEDGLRPAFIVANPPYVSATHLNAVSKRELATRFGSAWGRLDLYGLFLEQSLRVARPGGALSFITPDKWLTSTSSRPLRALVTAKARVRSIARFDRHDMFPGVATVPCVTVMTKTAVDTQSTQVEWFDLDGHGRVITTGLREPLCLESSGAPWMPETVIDGRAVVALGDIVERISVGMATGLNRCFVLDDAAASKIEHELLRPALRGRDIGNGTLTPAGLWLLMPYEFDSNGGSARLVDLADYPGARQHLEGYRDQLEARHCVRVWRKAWYDLHDPVLCDLARRPKIVLPDVAYTPRFALERGTHVPLHSAYHIVLREDAPITLPELLAILRSDSVAAELRRRAPTAKSGYRRFRAQTLRGLPIALPRPPASSQASLLDAA